MTTTTTGAAATRPIDRTAALVIAAVTGTAWAATVAWGHGGMTFATYLGAWTVMMVAMMLPSAAPFVLLYRKGASGTATVRLAAGYLAMWALTGVVAWSLSSVAMQVPAAVVLAGAGIYQLTPVKHACLRRCRSAADFLVQYWRPSAFVLGAHHGVYCLGCCWALMTVLVVAGMMSMIWVLAIAALVAAEKLLPWGHVVARYTGAGLLALALMEVTAWM